MVLPSPRFATPRRFDRPTYGGQVAKLARAFGQPLMPWQRHVADVALEVDPASGRLAHGLVVVTVQRQAGKTSLIRPVCLRPVMTRPDAGTWITAQRRNDARDTWLATVRAVERSPLSAGFTVRRTNGSESVQFGPTGGEYRPFAPMEEALHGKTTHVVMVDEGWVFTAERGEDLIQAIVPTQVTVPDSQIWVLSTAGTARSGWLRGYVDAGRAALAAGEDPGFCYLEWGIGDDVDVEDLPAVAAAHPAFGHTIDLAALVKARKAMRSPAAFGRAYGNRWSDAADYIIDPVVWESARTTDRLRRAPLALALETATDGSRTVVVAAGLVPGGAAAVEVVDSRPGTAGAAARLRELAGRFSPVAVAIDPHSPAAPVLRELERVKRRPRVPLLPVTAGDYVEAWQQFREGIEDGSIMHRSHRALDTACECATTRVVREQRVLSRIGAAELAAAMLAVHALRNPPAVVRPHLAVAHTGDSG